ncbi:MAG: hypothetical protein M1820_001846 [Bogoriella megaspora]|nr:MAG: hypothetical protein M1820_001846 [Bogoriella megaspora]
MRSMLDSLRDSQAAESPAAIRSLQTPPTPSINLDSPSNPNAALLIPDSISDQLARELFQTFIDYLLPQYPIVIIQEPYDALRVSKPVLLLAAVAAASSTREQYLFAMLHSHLVRQVTEKAIIEGERSIELIQSILILETWYYPPDDLRRLNFYQWIHIAGTMALQLGLGGARDLREPDLSKPDSENRRTMFAVFQSCSQVAVSHGRRSLFNFHFGARKVLDAFGAASTSVLDKRLIAWMNLQVIAENIDRTSWHDSGLGFEGVLAHLDHWEQGLGPSVLNDVDYDLQELLPPFLSTHDQTKMPNAAVSPSYVRAVLGLISACRSILDTVIFLDDHLLRACPTTVFVRTLHAIKVLSLLKRARNHPNHAICCVIDEDSLKMNSYVSSLCEKLEAAAGQNRCRVPSMILGVAQKIATQIVESEKSTSMPRGAQEVEGANAQLLDPGLRDSTVYALGASSIAMGGSPAPFNSFSVPTSSSYADSFNMETPPDIMNLSDFETMVMPNFGTGYNHYSGFSGSENLPYTDNQIP